MSLPSEEGGRQFEHLSPLRPDFIDRQRPDPFDLRFDLCLVLT
jgi:hypothetical protein